MASYLALTPPGGPESSNRPIRFIRDGFSFLAFLFPVLWLAFNRLWLPAVLALVLQAASAEMSRIPGLLPAGLALGLALSLLTALEGRNLLARTLQLKGWRLEGVINADSVESAEEIYAGQSASAATTQMPAPDWGKAETNAQTGTVRRDAPAIGLFPYDGGRR
ncbi:DUF2628 domain-containing protein [Rhizobiaceae bacterium n13]|uniref:DUF2628 domain-containing protein n=1 Tax=Ferirhizobium litorale TaxID=2927786 RepID=A0AAE3QDY1_9HYPH|nr:DUF2628 domain-containing protein [Fererhizobium litorale]MDI7863003.1 DUF2628 domain-containing protein [Fererhizobium litorale]MDI7923320.1 DUF2628 domain-containing protein [Fererhizobium litorale]